MGPRCAGIRAPTQFPAKILGGFIVKTEEQKCAYLLSQCQTSSREFTLAEIVERMLAERPDMILEFAETWENLIESQKIRICRRGRPNTYEVVTNGL
jgi:hypothetical protein